MANKIPVGILGATGIVGQRFIQMLEHHPWFEVAWLAASDRSEGRLYADAARWKLKTAIPKAVRPIRANTSTKATMNRAGKPSSMPKMSLILFSPSTPQQRHCPRGSGSAKTAAPSLTNR